MKRGTMKFLAAIIAISCFFTAAGGEKAGLSVTAGEGWSWESGAVDMIEGEIDLSEYSGRELTVRITTDLPYENEEEDVSGPVFVTVNGSRITVKKQSDTARCTPSSEQPVMDFSARFTLPEKKRVYKITFSFIISDDSGNELETRIFEMDGAKSGTGSVFYISADIYRITLYIGIAAMAVWCAALCRLKYNKNKKKRGDITDADI